jgi:hypothetical protein
LVVLRSEIMLPLTKKVVGVFVRFSCRFRRPSKYYDKEDTV